VVRHLFFAVALIAALQADTSIAITNARVLNVRAGQYETGITLLVRDGRIAARGRNVSVPATARRIDATGLTLLPGLIDTHVHLTIGGAPPRENARKTLQAGFTTVVDLGSPNGAGARVARRIDQDSIVGPRMIAAGSWIGGRGGVCEFGGATVRGAAEALGRATSDFAADARILKVCITGWLPDALAAPDSIEMTDAELDAIARFATQSSLPLAAHALTTRGVRAALRVQVRQLAHTPIVDDATASAIATARVCVSTTLATLQGSDRTGALLVSFDRLRKAGVRLVFGTDAGVLPHGENAREFDALLDFGMKPIEAIRAATSQAADCFGLGDYGALSVGERADLIAVSGDPLVDLSGLKDPKLVVKAGNVVSEKL
jgi:imidazolonepropionase-like amidohydrolase